MKVRVIKEAGFVEALVGISLSYGKKPNKKVADRLAFQQGGHNKFLESMMVWIDIDAPRYWWSQFDTYRVGTTKQSESTMHTLANTTLTEEHFEGGCDPVILEIINSHHGDLIWLKKHLPESFLQRRIICTNYKVLQNMIAQRNSHRLPEWQLFIGAMDNQCKYNEYLFKETI